MVQLGCFAPCEAREFRWLRPAGISPRARGDRERCPLDPAIWVVRRPLARVVGEEFCVRARCGFAAILDVWQEAAPPPWRKRPGERRRHTGGGQPSQEKNRVKLLNVGILSCFSDLVRWFSRSAVRLSIHASHCCGERAKGPSAPPGADSVCSRRAGAMCPAAGMHHAIWIKLIGSTP